MARKWLRTITDNYGKYELNFSSNQTQFNVTASYLIHKSATKTVNTSQKIENNRTVMHTSADLKLGKPKAIFLFTSASAISNALMNALDQNPHFTSEIYLLKNILQI